MLLILQQHSQQRQERGRTQLTFEDHHAFDQS